MESNVEPDKTGKRKRTLLPMGEEESIACVCQVALFKFVLGVYQPVVQSTKGLATEPPARL
jgi:hypothetical protein